VREFARREEIILAFTRDRIGTLISKLRGDLIQSTAATTQECLEFARVDGVKASKDEINDCCQQQLALKFRGSKLRKKDGPSVADALNQLLGCLDATVRKALAETSFEFILKFDGDGNPERAEEMTLPQFFMPLRRNGAESLQLMKAKLRANFFGELKSIAKSQRSCGRNFSKKWTIGRWMNIFPSCDRLADMIFRPGA
jgi:hypothetical protein